MNVCIVGTGASGLLAACELIKLDFIKKITIIGSSKIPSIKVGESTTLSFYDYVRKHFDEKEFVTSTDASVKFGVYFKNWSKRDYIHAFGSEVQFKRNNLNATEYFELLSNKDPAIEYHNIISPKLWNFVRKNEVSLNYDEYPYTWHFDAGKLKLFLKKKLNKDKRINFVDDTIIHCQFSNDNEINYIVGKNNDKYIADYYINCSGNNLINNNLFKETYKDLSEYLLTNKAIVCPISYKNKQQEFHPYTVAKAMNHGWRWITPTQSRIGTGYVFSDNHISVDQAINEFLTDIGDNTLEPFVVDFTPRCSVQPYKINYCSIGMASGFLEPLDAPGLSLTTSQLYDLVNILNAKNKNEDYFHIMNNANFEIMVEYQFWCSYILHQYKTCWKTNTPFWKDHKNITCPFYDNIIRSLENIPEHLFEYHEYEMFFKTTAAKDITWKSKTDKKPFTIEELESETMHHIDFIKSFYL